MSIKITNGVLVHRLWGDLENAEIVAHFQYERDAKDFVEKCIGNGTSSDLRFIVTNVFDGNQWCRVVPAEASS